MYRLEKSAVDVFLKQQLNSEDYNMCIILSEYCQLQTLAHFISG